jgi:predicted secreted protein
MLASPLWLFLLLVLASCTTIIPLGEKTDPNAPMVGPGQRLNLPRPAELGRSVMATQLITAHAYGQTFVMEMNISVTPKRVMMVGVDPMGRRAMTLTWNEQEVSAEMAPWVPDTLRPGSILADIILIYWPEAAVRKALPAGGEVFQEARNRTIRVNHKDILRVEYSWTAGAQWNGTLHYNNFIWGYEIDVQSSEQKQ